MSDTPKISEDRKFVLLFSLQFFTVCAAAFGAWTFFRDEDLRVQREQRQASLEMIAEYTSDPTRSSRERLFQFWILNPVISRSLSKNMDDLGSRPPQEAIEAFFVQRFGSASDTISSDLYVVADFFDELLFCMGSDICDLQVSKSYFCLRTERMHRTYEPAMRVMRQLSQDLEFGTSMAEILEMYCAFEG